jgi:hypothetical protein
MYNYADFFLRLMRGGNGRKSTMTERVAGTEIMMRLPEQLLELVFSRKQTELLLFFSLEQGWLNNLTPFAHVQKVLV